MKAGEIRRILTEYSNELNNAKRSKDKSMIQYKYGNKLEYLIQESERDLLIKYEFSQGLNPTEEMVEEMVDKFLESLNQKEK